MTTIRQQRVQELLYQELSILIGNELEDPKLSLLTVTNVQISRDLKHAKVSIHHQDKSIPRRVVLQRLERATPFIRRQIAARLSLPAVPEFLFYYDDTPERAARVDALLERIRAEREENDTETGPAATGQGGDSQGEVSDRSDSTEVEE